jgi:hypothetical protein
LLPKVETFSVNGGGDAPVSGKVGQRCRWPSLVLITRAFHLLLYVTESKVGAELLAGLLLALWHFTWSIPFLCFHPSAAWLIMGFTCVLGSGRTIQKLSSDFVARVRTGLPLASLFFWAAGRKKLSNGSQEARALASNL